MPDNNAYLKTAQFEGYKPKVYLDTKKKKTIGYGFNLDEPVIKDYLTKKGYNYKALATGKQALSKEQSNNILKDLYSKSYENTKKIVKNFEVLPEDVKNVLTDLDYNLGTTKLKKFSKMISAIENNDFKTAAEELKNSNYYNQTGRRAKSHYDLLSTITPVFTPKPKEVKEYNPSWGETIKEAVSTPGLTPAIIGQKLMQSFFKDGGLIKRADGSYSQRGLWDNIRANKGSGRKPTAEMLHQESKIRAAEKKGDGGWLDSYKYGGSIEDQRIPTPTSPSSYPAYTNPTLTNYQMGTPKSNLPIRGLRDATPKIPAYAAGATVWTKQDTPTWAAGTPTPTATQNFKNTNSINTSRYRIGDVIPTGMDYKTPAAGTKDYSRVMTSYDWNNQRRLHAPDTTIMRDGGDIKKNIPGLKYHILNSYANGSLVNFNTLKQQAQGGWLDNL